MKNTKKQYNDEAVAVRAGNIAQWTNDADETWHQIGANWAVSRTLYEEMRTQA